MTKQSLVIAILVCAAIAALFVFTKALSLVHAIAIGIGVLVIWFITRPYFRRPAPWPKPPRTYRAGGRTDLAELSWMAFTRDGRVTDKLVTRIRQIAARRLAAQGVLWTGERTYGDPLSFWGTGPDDASAHYERASELMGSTVLQGLNTAAEAVPRVVDSWCQALDRLAALPPATVSARIDLSELDPDLLTETLRSTS